MQIQEQLELILPTYNRKEHLKRTLSQLTAADSPVKNCLITVLNNASTDGSKELIEDFAAKYSNIKPIHHPKNIGGNGNIVNAFEIARAPYVWVVCDDDSFKWEAWGEVEQALFSNEYDLLLTRKDDLKGTEHIAKIVRQCSFLPAAIYRTANITGGVLINMLNNVVNLFPHLALVCEILNKQGTIFLPQGEIMDECTFAENTGDGFSTRGSDTYSAPIAQNMFWTVGFIASLGLIKDTKLRAYIIDNLGKHGFLGYMIGAFRKNYTHYGGNSLNIALINNVLNTKQKLQFFLARCVLRIITILSRKKHL